MIIYKVTNKINNKIYIGQTIISLIGRKNDHKRKSEIHNSKSSFHSAIRKYGFENFTWEIIDKAKNRKELNEKEIFWINYYNTLNNKYGYNLRHGGSEVIFTDDVKKRIGMAQKGKTRSKEFKNKISKVTKGKRNPFYGKKHTEETKKKISQSKTGKKGIYTKESKERCIKRGEENGRSKLKYYQVIEIKKLLENKERICVISEKLNITQNSIKGIKYGHTWKHIKI